MQAIGAVQDAGVQAVQDDVCSQLARLVTDALYRGDQATAARLLAAAFVQGGCWVLGAGCTGQQLMTASARRVLARALTNLPSTPLHPSLRRRHLCQGHRRRRDRQRPAAGLRQAGARAGGCLHPGQDRRWVGEGGWVLRWCVCDRSLLPGPPTSISPPLSSHPCPPPGAEAAFVATLSANAGLVAVLRACLTPAQLAYGATLPTTNPAAQVSSGMGCCWVVGQGASC